jgi:peptidoglycan hydrolase CwlO-like protein
MQSTISDAPFVRHVAGDNSGITVCVRVRPSDKPSAVSVVGKSVVVQDSQQFNYDYCWDGSASQEAVYKVVGAPVVDNLLKGFNQCIFAYGMSGSGKTHLVFGSLASNETMGLIPRISEEIFSRLSGTNGELLPRYTLTTSFIEIYCEQIKDLLADGSATPDGSLRVRQSSAKGVYVSGATVKPLNQLQDLYEALAIGQKRRSVAATNLNSQSSRSHSIFTINTLERKGASYTVTKIHLVDLAGSEPINKSGVEGIHAREAIKINKSLSQLGLVINKLAERAGKNIRRASEHIPYRDSVLTFLLSEALGGNSKTTMIATISPDTDNLTETLSTLRYAATAKKITNNVKANELLEEDVAKAMMLLKEENGTLTAVKQELMLECASLRSKIQLLERRVEDGELAVSVAVSEAYAKGNEAMERKDATIAELQTLHTAALSDADRRAATLVSNLTDLRDKLTDTDGKLTDARDELEDTRRDLAAARHDLAAHQALIDKLTADIAERQREITKLEQDIIDLNFRLHDAEQERDEYKRQVSDMDRAHWNKTASLASVSRKSAVLEEQTMRLVAESMSVLQDIASKNDIDLDAVESSEESDAETVAAADDEICGCEDGCERCRAPPPSRPSAQRYLAEKLNKALHRRYSTLVEELSGARRAALEAQHLTASVQEAEEKLAKAQAALEAAKKMESEAREREQKAKVAEEAYRSAVRQAEAGKIVAHELPVAPPSVVKFDGAMISLQRPALSPQGDRIQLTSVGEIIVMPFKYFVKPTNGPQQELVCNQLFPSRPYTLHIKPKNNGATVSIHIGDFRSYLELPVPKPHA